MVAVAVVVVAVVATVVEVAGVLSSGFHRRQSFSPRQSLVIMKSWWNLHFACIPGW